MQVRPKLNSEAKEIRVIELQPGNYNDPIVVKSITTSLLDSIPFEPLSYAWGDPNVTMPIEMDGSTYPVTTNLYSALRNLRKPSEVRLMWVINQRDDEEKSQQVNLMRDIYASANTCVVWFGDFLDQGITMIEATATLNTLRKMAEEHPRKLLVNYEGVNGERLTAAMSVFMRNEWWKRLWTLQEIVLPPKAVIAWGLLSLPWEIVSSAAFNRVNTMIPSYQKAADPIMNESLSVFDSHLTAGVIGIKFLREFWQGERSMTPIEVFWRTGARKSTDPRDKVYSLAGLLSKFFCVETNYSLTTVQVYCKAVVSIIS